MLLVLRRVSPEPVCSVVVGLIRVVGLGWRQHRHVVLIRAVGGLGGVRVSAGRIWAGD